MVTHRTAPAPYQQTKMTIEELRLAKKELELSMEKTLGEFTEKTGLRVELADLAIMEVRTVEGLSRYICNVDIRL